MPNRLAGESSPYLRQHADNPVDWYPWGADAKADAVARDTPILLSVGYSSCHWCHVMAHESFEDSATADVMNELYVNVKVDREERPDVDAIYMDAVVAMTGQGGWPMTVFLAPDGRPFYGGTYYPNESRGGMPAFTDVLRAVHEAWVERRDHVFEQADQLTEALGRVADAPPTDLPTDDSILAGIGVIRGQYDSEWGGFGSQPKFPQAMTIDLLLRSHVGDRAPGLLEIATGSLDAMAAGGIYDHLGGGFARYSVDREWLVPHFEKMLYDQALLTKAYLHAWQVTGNDNYRQVVDETIGYLLRDLSHPDGGFYSAEDADSEGVEGKFYTWSIDEFSEVLRAADLDQTTIDAANTWWNVTEVGNFAEGGPGANILHRPLHADLGRPADMEAARRALFAHRAGRIRPGLDDKVLAEWNALMLASLADAAVATGNEQWRDAAVRNGEFLCAQLRRADGRWLRSWQADTGGRGTAFAADHGALITAFLRLARLTGKARWVAEARTAADALIDLFWDHDRGGVFTTGIDAEELLTRPKDMTDNALPSANSHAAVALLELSHLTGDERYREHGEACLRLFTGIAPQNALFFGHALAAVDAFTAAPSELVVTGERADLVAVADNRYLPNTVVAWGEPFDSPLWADRQDGAAYLCEGFACRLPVDDPGALSTQLDGLGQTATAAVPDDDT